ncbi:PaaI family thioesterase [Natrinema halophilum]|uniref:PaaI family thioesterase n=1 Tax=Natrinema halophilum TaxID=1699371 RepID=UPI001F3AF8AC|nr:PaaI family thioesterase [Natrinema halophilum]UHQ96327.1 PaaI family thioesterase [Natrinema halophilum]
MDVSKLIGESEPPYYELIGFELLEADDGYARGHIPLTERNSGVNNRLISHGGLTASIADIVGYWAVSSANDFGLTPTVDLRIDYVAPALDDLYAEGTVQRNGDSTATVDVTVTADDEVVALARGQYKTSGASAETAWGL